MSATWRNSSRWPRMLGRQRAGMPAVSRATTRSRRRGCARRSRWVDAVSARFGSKADVAEVVKFALEVWMVICPECFENLDHLIGMARPVLQTVPPGQQTPAPPAHTPRRSTDHGQGINRGEHFRHHHRVAMAQDKRQMSPACAVSTQCRGSQHSHWLQIGSVQGMQKRPLR